MIMLQCAYKDMGSWHSANTLELAFQASQFWKEKSVSKNMTAVEEGEIKKKDLNMGKGIQ